MWHNHLDLESCRTMNLSRSGTFLCLLFVIDLPYKVSQSMPVSLLFSLE